VIELRGMTWNHPRGLEPLNAHAREYAKRHGVDIIWDARSLEDFEAFSLDELAAKYDLMVIDHPHVGMAAASGCLLPFDPSIHFDTAGRSHESYHYAGRQWALAIDAAAQVSARQSGALDRWPRTWDEVMELASAGGVLCPLAPVHALMCFFTLCANEGHPCATEGDELVVPIVGANVLSRLAEFAALLPRECFGANPISIFRLLYTPQYIYCPLIYGYVTYALRRSEPSIEFGDIPGVRGSTLGGTGIAVSSRSRHTQLAAAVAIDLASSGTQRGIYARAGGQPAHRDAWADDVVNAAANDFFRNTLATLDASYVRPRFDGYIGFQQSAGELICACLRGQMPPTATIQQINALFATAQRTK
jgi:multiple sugar transport system substrate-binding protein